LAAGDRVAVQTGDLGQQGNSPATVLVGQKADQEAPSAFVRGGHEPVDPAVLPGQ
jgi:hypothetical protein